MKREKNPRWATLLVMIAPLACGDGDPVATGQPPAHEAEAAEAALLTPPSPEPGRFVSRWAERALTVVKAAGIGTLPATRIYAIVDVAMYDAVNGIDRARFVGREHALVPPTGAPFFGLRAAAAVAAAHAALVALIPAQTATLDQALAADLAELGGGSPVAAHARATGLAYGAEVGRRAVALRSTDGTQTAFTLPPSTEPGRHRTSFDARWSRMAPFAITSKDPYRAPPPPALGSAVYTMSFLDAKANGTHDGNPLHEAIATFWGGDEGGAWQLAGKALAERKGLHRSISATARLFALIGMAVADSASVSHVAKVDHFTWRVVPAIREAATDGNDLTIPDPTWAPRNGTGNLGSPEYTSGASAFAGGASAAIEHFFCTSQVSFCFATETAALPRCFPSPAAAAEETGRARVLQGVHFQHSSDAGIAQGRAVGAEVGKKLRVVLPTGRILPGCQ